MLPKTRKKLIREMEVLCLPICEISSQLSELVGQVSYIELASFPADVFVSDLHDVAIRSRDEEPAIEVAEPTCGVPNMELVLYRDNTSLGEEISEFWEATCRRKELLQNVMAELLRLNGGDLLPRGKLRMADVAEACGVHVTHVSRALDQKKCLIEQETFSCLEFIRGFEPR